jgi:hypothetical protein
MRYAIYTKTLTMDIHGITDDMHALRFAREQQGHFVDLKASADLSEKNVRDWVRSHGHAAAQLSSGPLRIFAKKVILEFNARLFSSDEPVQTAPQPRGTVAEGQKTYCSMGNT